MGMSFAYGPVDEAEAAATLNASLDAGYTFLDTADIYGSGHNERFIGEVVGSRRDEITLATKFGIMIGADGYPSGEVNGRPEYVRAAIDASLSRLGFDHVDLYYLHRPDLEVPIEETVGAMAELVTAGKVRYLGLSEASAQTVRRAAAVATITALQSEWSIFSRDIEVDIVPTCRELGIGLVAYSPLGRGMLTGSAAATTDLTENDFRRTQPRWQGENLDANLALVDRIGQIAAGIGAKPSQVALAWLLARGGDVVPIPGTKRRRYLMENLDAVELTLSDRQIAELDALSPTGERTGDRVWVNRDTPVAG
ncbi:aldo/keto reductase [Microlunatus elymi]|uniref:Aldo/keto reductase n=2 Tax=Microlunatus elymi TaxID=2596828 RepID=A0A516Q666_9ACTN|nr:aldo/keto reductase [Microlunatus elymi]